MTKKRWGYFKILIQGKGFWVKRLHFSNGRATSFQSHAKRDELWMIWVPKGVKHKVGGKGDVFELALGNPKEKDIKKWRLQ